MQQELFNAIEHVKLHVLKLDGPWNGGHIHIDIKIAFQNDPQKLKSFIIDQINHPEFSNGVLVWDPINAKPINIQKKKKELEYIFDLLDKWTEEKASLDFDKLEMLKKNLTIFGKGSALNINLSYGTVEVRGLRSYTSPQHLIKMVNLLDARIKYTNSHPQEINWHKNQKMSTYTKSLSFKKYIEETGLTYENYYELAAKRFRIGSTCNTIFSAFTLRR